MAESAYVNDTVPSTVKVLHRTFQIEEVDMVSLHRDNQFGSVDHIKGHITYVDTGDSETADTIVHELLHCLWKAQGLVHLIPPEHEEAIVSILSTGLVTLFRDNPELFRALIDIAEGDSV